MCCKIGRGMAAFCGLRTSWRFGRRLNAVSNFCDSRSLRRNAWRALRELYKYQHQPPTKPNQLNSNPTPSNPIHTSPPTAPTTQLYKFAELRHRCQRHGMKVEPTLCVFGHRVSTNSKCILLRGRSTENQARGATLYRFSQEGGLEGRVPC